MNDMPPTPPAIIDDAATREAAMRQANLRVVRDFIDKVVNRGDLDGAVAHLGPRYTQHVPTIADGVDGFRAYFTHLRQTFPHLRGEVKRMIAERDLVVVHMHARRAPDDAGLAIIDIFRLDGGRIVEHWDVRQPVPETSQNPNGMF